MLRISLEALQVLDAIARRGSYSAAGEELHRSASTLSYTITTLEKQLGVRVFDRSGHRARPTTAGQALLEEGRHLLDDAAALERRVRNVAHGWEAQLSIACDELVGTPALFPLLKSFYAGGYPTRIRVTAEVLSGSWDALLSGRAALAIAQEGLAPTLGISTRSLGKLQLAFVCSPRHPLARVQEPLRLEQLRRHRRVATGDTSRALTTRSAGFLDAEETLTVSTMQAKIDAHVAGLGVGFIPRSLAGVLLKKGALVEKRVAEAPTGPNLCVAWRTREAGRALKWFLEQLEDSSVRRALMGQDDASRR
jgi:DNA-binding transcriptional LysR family regulator